MEKAQHQKRSGVAVLTAEVTVKFVTAVLLFDTAVIVLRLFDSQVHKSYQMERKSDTVLPNGPQQTNCRYNGTSVPSTVYGFQLSEN